MMQAELLDKLQSLARTQHLLVACDYDGTLAELVVTPAFAFPNSTAIKALHALGEIASTTTAIVSGRPLQDLRDLLGAEAPYALVGSHGAEWQKPGVILTRQQQELLTHVASIVASIADQGNGVSRELKPASVALHVRSAPRPVAECAIVAAMEQCCGLPGVNVRPGSEVIEFMVVETDKGDAVRRLRHHVEATAVVFIGDDLTDEDVFRTLSNDDLAVRVGPGETGAQFRIGGVPAVADLLSALGSLRRDWAHRRQLPPEDRDE